MKKLLSRHALMIASGQQFLTRKSASGTTRKVLWYYDWGTIGDAIMDLSQRFQIPEEISIDLCMPYGPITLFANDTRFRRVCRSISDCDRQYDLIIFQNLTTKTILKKIRHFPLTRFCTIMGHQRNEDFSRIHLSHERLSRFFGFERVRGPIEPTIGLTAPRASASTAFHILVAVGGNDKRRRFNDWPSVLRTVDAQWPASHAKPTYVIVGAGAYAREAAVRITEQVAAGRVVSQLDLQQIDTAANLIADSSFFVGADGGLMHIAAALRKHGVGVFSEIRPEWRLHPDSKMKSIFTDGDINDIPAEQIGHAVIGYCSELLADPDGYADPAEPPDTAARRPAGSVAVLRGVRTRRDRGC